MHTGLRLTFGVKRLGDLVVVGRPFDAAVDPPSITFGTKLLLGAFVLLPVMEATVESRGSFWHRYAYSC